MSMVLCSGKKIKVGDKVGEFTRNCGYPEAATLAAILADALIVADELTGAPKRDVLSYRPMAVFHILQYLTNVDLTEYSDDTEKLYRIADDVEETPEFLDIYNEVQRIYHPLSKARMQLIRDKNSVAAQLMKLNRVLFGSDENKDAGLIRSMLTELFVKMERENKKSPSALTNVVDLSMFKKKDK